MPKTKKYKPLDLDLKPLNNYVEANSEISKETLIRRCAGKVDRTFLNLMKLLQFYIIGKDERGEIYIS